MRSYRYLQTFHRPASFLQSLKENLAVFLMDVGASLDQTAHKYQYNLVSREKLNRHITAESIHSSIPSINPSARVSHQSHLLGYVSVGYNARIEPFSSLKGQLSSTDLCTAQITAKRQESHIYHWQCRWHDPTVQKVTVC